MGISSACGASAAFASRLIIVVVTLTVCTHLLLLHRGVRRGHAREREPASPLGGRQQSDERTRPVFMRLRVEWWTGPGCPQARAFMERERSTDLSRDEWMRIPSTSQPCLRLAGPRCRGRRRPVFRHGRRLSSATLTAVESEPRRRKVRGLARFHPPAVRTERPAP